MLLIQFDYFCRNIPNKKLKNKLLLTLFLFNIISELYALPSVTITSSNLGTKFRGGDEVVFKAYATDPTDGVLKKNKFSWQINYRHDDHWHDNWSSLPEDSVFLYQFPITGDPSSQVYFKIRVTVTNSLNETQTADYDIYPHISTFTITSNVVGAKFQLGTGTVITTPSVLSSVENLNFSLSNYLQTQTISGVSYNFRHWSFCSTANAVFFNVPQNDTLITMYFAETNSTTTGFIEGCDNTTSKTLTGLSNNYNINNEIIIFPNPSSNKIYLKSNEIIKKICVKDNLGQIQKIDFDNAKSDIDISDLLIGLYFIEIETDKNIYIKKFNKN